jgi:uncharacterized protein (DUF1330 family)
VQLLLRPASGTGLQGGTYEARGLECTRGSLGSFGKQEVTAYFMAQIAWNSPEARQAYITGLSGMVEKHGGRFIVTSSESRVVEGKWLPGRLVVVEFPTMQALREWYDSDEYRPLLEMRLKGSQSEAIMVEGNVPAPAK